MVDLIYSILDHLSAVLLVIPYALIGIGVTSAGKLFALFSYGLIFLLPSGLIVLALQLSKKKFKVRPDRVTYTISLFNTGFGVFGLMLIYAVTSS